VTTEKLVARSFFCRRLKDCRQISSLYFRFEKILPVAGLFSAASRVFYTVPPQVSLPLLENPLL